MLRRWEQILWLCILMLGCGCCGPNGPMGRTFPTHTGRLVLDQNNVVHLIYTRPLEGKVMHVYHTDEGLRRQVIAAASTERDGAAIRHVFVTQTGVCVDLDWLKAGVSSAPRNYVRYCHDGNQWNTQTLVGLPSEIREYYSFADGTVLAVREIDTENGKVDELLQADPLDGTIVASFGILPTDTQMFSEEGDAGLEIDSPFPIPFFEFGNGTWDGKSFLGEAAYWRPKEHVYSRLYSAHFDGVAKWTKISESKQFIGLTTITWGHGRVTRVGKKQVATRDPESGDVVLQDLQPPYDMLLGWKILPPPFPLRDNSYSFESTILVDATGRVHVVVDEGPEFHQRIYYHVYNPASPTPSKPEVREFVKALDW